MDTDPMAELPADVKQHMTRYKAPPGLERRIRHMIAQESRRPSWRERSFSRFALTPRGSVTRTNASPPETRFARFDTTLIVGACMRASAGAAASTVAAHAASTIPTPLRPALIENPSPPNRSAGVIPDRRAWGANRSEERHAGRSLLALRETGAGGGDAGRQVHLVRAHCGLGVGVRCDHVNVAALPA